MAVREGEIERRKAVIRSFDRAGLAPVDEETRGHAIKRRREALGMSINALAKKVGMDRATLTSAEADEERTTDLTYRRIENWLTDFEAETGAGDSSGDDLVEFRLSGNFGVDVVVKGPVANLPELERSISRLLREMRDPGV